jgi:hypothetical protein
MCSEPSPFDFLCDSISAAGVRPLPLQGEAVPQFPPPETVKELHAFLGMVNFYRRFQPAVAKTWKPLTVEACMGPTPKHIDS